MAESTTLIRADANSVSGYLMTGKDTPFVIPEYQRSYEWDEDQVQTLFSDLWDFTITSPTAEEEKRQYFLGSIVQFKNENGEHEIIDGQQRITSLLLLLRAIYTKLKLSSESNDITTNLISEIEKTIWKVDSLTGKVKNYDDIMLESKVLDYEGNRTLRNILRTGIADAKATDNYSRNYLKFIELYENASKDDPFKVYYFVLAVLKQAVVLPITADSQDTALTIFTTLNDRGLPLSDADIFKAKIYSHLSTVAEKTSFIESWKDLDARAADADESIQHLLYFYMYYLKAQDKDSNNTMPSLRNFYAGTDKKNKFSRLYDDKLIENLSSILNIWTVVNMREEIDDESWSRNIKILQALDILNSYPNEFWKYPVVTFYLVHHKKEEFDREFLRFLNMLILSLLNTFLKSPTINAVKTSIFKLDIAITESIHPSFDFNRDKWFDLKKESERNQFGDAVKMPPDKAVRMLLKLLAYDEQDTLLPGKWEIEHILPRKWQPAYFSNSSKEDIERAIEHLGNKVPFEKKLNIIASNGYFDKKKEEYRKSAIKIVNNLGSLSAPDWNTGNIIERDVRVSDKILKIFDDWTSEYNI